ncbi:MAG: hypothetical protein ACPLZH_00150 [Minisyncoccales bacterium]
MKNFFIFFLFFSLIFQNVFAQAQDLLNLFRGVALALTGLFIVIGAYQIVVSEGDPGRMQEAKKTIIFALIGFGLALAIETIVAMIGRLFV